MRRWLAPALPSEGVAMTYDDWKTTEPALCDEAREVPCLECGGDSEGGHAVWCSHDPDYFEPPDRDFDDDEIEVPCDGD